MRAAAQLNPRVPGTGEGRLAAARETLIPFCEQAACAGDPGVFMTFIVHRRVIHYHHTFSSVNMSDAVSHSCYYLVWQKTLAEKCCRASRANTAASQSRTPRRAAIASGVAEAAAGAAGPCLENSNATYSRAALHYPRPGGAALKKNHCAPRRPREAARRGRGRGRGSVINSATFRARRPGHDRAGVRAGWWASRLPVPPPRPGQVRRG